MPAVPSLNKNNAAVKRIMQEARELANDPCTDYHAEPLEVFFIQYLSLHLLSTLSRMTSSNGTAPSRGPSGTEFEGGLYHFRILLPAEYPFRPPSLMMLTPNGRFRTQHKDHEEEWQPAWGVRTAILGLQGFFPLKGSAANGVGSVEYPVSERKRLALMQVSREWVCPKCQQTNLECLPDPLQHATTTLNESMGLRGLSRAPDQLEPPVSRPSPTPLPPAPERSPVPETTISDLDQAAISTLVTESRPSIVGEQDRTPSGTAATRGSQLPVHHRSHRPPLLLDTAICLLLVLVVALLCRRVLCPQQPALPTFATMSLSLVVHDTITKKRSSLLTYRRRPDATPIPPTLLNSPYLASPNSIFQRKNSVLKWPSQEDDEWLRDMVPMGRHLGLDVDSKSESSNDTTPSPTSSDSSFTSSLFPPSSSLLPPSPLLRPRTTSLDVATPAKRALCGSGSGPSPHT
ncbi:ubiquitin-conjugating enzyme/RWD-like protein [Boletus reticuloceps]|uniref:Ubiquitin-conjugating enzyme/RWD-like protein n=1 Tax=Boletus reticuloceps TaxID=495285 RepID=A0A8I3AAA5_9AGAM|nr:ubiquitin-conjugating enzyme/RWD-like protein [Boletus reticuloceps]